MGVTAEGRYGPPELAENVRHIKERFPFVQSEIIGISVMGRPIFALKAGSGPFLWHFNGGCHANEWITAPLLMRFLEEYAEAYASGGEIGGKPAAALFGKTTLWIVPMLNPDGAELVQSGLPTNHPFYQQLLRWNGGSHNFQDWKANVRGVDLNDQFPAHWEDERARRGANGPGPRDYGGPSPLSEPEARALADFTIKKKFDAVLSLHTQGEEIYWNYRGFEPELSRKWAEKMACAAGYTAVYLEGSDAGYKDWFIQTFGKPGFTVEAGSGRNPLPWDDFEAISRRLNRLLAAALDLAPPVH
jgi:g-D-glutamyl-meso-diaminopimelate peptidase